MAGDQTAGDWLIFITSLRTLEGVSWHIAGFLLLLACVAFQQYSQQQRQVREKEARDEELDKDVREQDEEEGESEELPNHPHLQGTFVPYSGEFLKFPNKERRAYHYSNELVDGSTLTVHRATWDPELDRSGDYPFGYVFKDRKKVNWEVRVQLRLKQPVEGALKFGIELDDYVPLMGTTKVAMKAVVTALQYIVGHDLHHSPGDDPAVTEGECERPVFAMPFWAMDQFIETPDGEKAPDLTDPDFMNMGIKRADDTKAFTRTMNDLKLRPGPTYTFNFWSISALIDNVMWKIGGVIPGVQVDFNQFCGRPPVHVAYYVLRPPPAGSKETRHLDSRKRYLFHLAFWSSLHQPPSHRLRQLLPRKSVAAAERSPACSTKSVSSKKDSALTLRRSSTAGLQGAALRAGPSERQGQTQDFFLSCFDGLRPSSSRCLPCGRG